MNTRRKRKVATRDCYVFRRPLWQRSLPLFLLVCVWACPVLYTWLLTATDERTWFVAAQASAFALLRRGVTPQTVSWFAAAISLPLFYALHRGFEKLIVTPDTIVRALPLRARQAMRWVDADEVLIRHVRYWLEGREGVRRELILYGKPRHLPPWRPKLRISDREFDGYKRAERLAVQIAVPAIAARRRLELARNGGLEFFGVPSWWHDFVMVAYAGLATALFVTTAGSHWGMHAPTWLRYGAVAAAAFLMLMAARRFFVTYYALDVHHLYVYRRFRGRRKIPLMWLREAGVRNGRLIIAGHRDSSEKVTQFVSEKRFFRNRGVFLAMIRLGVQELRTAQLRVATSAEGAERALPVSPPQVHSPTANPPREVPPTTPIDRLPTEPDSRAPGSISVVGSEARPIPPNGHLSKPAIDSSRAPEELDA